MLNVPISVFVEVTYTVNVALALPVASTRSRRFPESYSATWIETVSAATVRVAVGLERTGVAVGGITVAVNVGGAKVGVEGAVEVGGATVDVDGRAVAVGRRAVGVRVRVGEVMLLITNKRMVDHAPLVPPAVRPRTRHQNVRSLVSV